MIKTQNLDLICIKFHQKNKKPKTEILDFWGF